VDTTVLGVVNQVPNLVQSVANLITDPAIAVGTAIEPYSRDIDAAVMSTPIPQDDMAKLVTGSARYLAMFGRARLAARFPSYVKVNVVEPSADLLANRLGGVSSVKCPGRFSEREFDVFTSRYIGQTKPANYQLSSAFRNRARATFEAAKELERTPYFHFNGAPGSGVIEKRTIEWPSGRAEMLLMNGENILLLNAIPNRRRSEANDLNKIIGIIIHEFKGAYGIIYEYDEGVVTPEGRGLFTVKVIKRGKCESALDPFLSPTIPVVEDPS
jgi:hypothetical protein